MDLQGKVVAINTAIIPYAQGIGFAIPINSASRRTNEIIAHGSMIRPWLGVSGLTVTREVASYYGLPIDIGVLVTRVIPDSPADNAGIVSGDMVLEFGGVATNSIERFVRRSKKERLEKKWRYLFFETPRGGLSKRSWRGLHEYRRRVLCGLFRTFMQKG